MVIHHCLPFADERRSVKCLGSAAGVSFPSPPLPPPPPLLLFCSFLPNALARLPRLAWRKRKRLLRRLRLETLKDHKDNFQNKPACRLINPAKSEIGRIRKQLLENINTTIRRKTGLNQWKNSTSVINWFSSIQDKHKHTFAVFDIENFYPSITEKLLTDAITFAKQHTSIKRTATLTLSCTHGNPSSSTKTLPGSRKTTVHLTLLWEVMTERKCVN